MGDHHVMTQFFAQITLMLRRGKAELLIVAKELLGDDPDKWSQSEVSHYVLITDRGVDLSCCYESFVVSMHSKTFELRTKSNCRLY